MAKIGAIIDAMTGSRRRVSFTDSDEVLYGVKVDAENLYDPIAIAVAQFREDDVSPSSLDPMTEFTVTVSVVSPHISSASAISGSRRSLRRRRVRPLYKA
jgi:hypothetical protein